MRPHISCCACAAELHATNGATTITEVRRLAILEARWFFDGTRDYCPEHAPHSDDRKAQVAANLAKFSESIRRMLLSGGARPGMDVAPLAKALHDAIAAVPDPEERTYFSAMADHIVLTGEKP